MDNDARRVHERSRPRRPLFFRTGHDVRRKLFHPRRVSSVPNGPPGGVQLLSGKAHDGRVGVRPREPAEPRLLEELLHAWQRSELCIFIVVCHRRSAGLRTRESETPGRYYFGTSGRSIIGGCEVSETPFNRENHVTVLTIGLTGGIGSGKSEAYGILRELGALVVDADIVGHETYLRGQPAWGEIVESFGKKVIGPVGEIDRRELGGIVFGDPDKLKQLTDIVWPRIRERLEARIAEERNGDDTTVLVVEAAVLFEAGWESLFDEIWVVTAPEEDVLERLERQRNQKPELTRARMRAQMTNEEREQRADVMVRNDEDRAALAVRVKQLWTDRTQQGPQGRHNG